MSTTLYVNDWGGATNQGARLFRVDPVTLSAEEIGPIGFPYIQGLAFRGEQLYGFSSKDGSSEHHLISIDTGTGKGKTIGVIGSGSPQAVAVAPDETLYCITRIDQAYQLITIDAASGAGTKVGELGNLIAGVGGLFFDTNSRLFSIVKVKDTAYPSNNGLYISPINSDTGVAEFAKGAQFQNTVTAESLAVLTYSDEGLLGASNGGHIYRLHVTTAEAIFLGPLGNRNSIWGMASLRTLN